MSKQVQNFIDDARRFQRCSDHDLAISSLQLAQQEDHHKEHEIEIQKLFSLSYRKIGNYNMALLHINNAINQNAKRNNDKQAQNEHAICLMNKGIIYEESKRYDNALDCYISAVDTFISLHKNNPEEHGLIIKIWIKNFTTFLIQAICLLSCFENVSLLTWVQTIGTGEARAIRIIF